MPLYQANTSFDHGGIRVQKGEVVEDDHFLYTLFPSRFTLLANALSAELPLALVDVGGGVDQIRARGVPRLLTSFSPSAGVTNTASETSLLSATFDTAADELAVGDIIQVEMWGTYLNNSGTTATTAWRLKADTLGMAQTTANLVISAATNHSWRYNATLLVQAAGAVSSTGLLTLRAALGTGNDESQQTVQDTTNTIDITQPITWDFTADHDAAHASLTAIMLGGLMWHTKV